MDSSRPQSQTGEMYNQQNAAYANQQAMQQMQNAFQSMNQNNYQTPAAPYSTGNQSAGQLATPVYDMQNPYANLQATSQAQLQALQTNITEQKQLRKMQSEGLTGVTEAVRLYRSFGKTKNGDDFADMAMGLPGVSSTIFSRRAEEIRSKVGSAASRVSGKYAGALSGEFRHEKSAKTAALQMGESAFIDYMTGKIINQNYADPTLDSSMVEAVARKRAIDLMDFYVSQLPSKRIKNSTDLEKLMRMADAVGGDIDIDTIGHTMQKFKQLGIEKALLDAQNDDIRSQIDQSRESGLDLAYGNDEYDMQIEMDQNLMGAEQVESISFLNAVSDGIVGVLKEGGSLLNTIGVNLFGKGAAIGVDLLGSAVTGELHGGARDIIHQISDKLNEMVADGDPSNAESASRMAVKIFLAYTVGAAMLPAAGVVSATLAGGGMMMAGSLGQSAIGSLTGSIGDMLFGTEDDDEHITPARELFDDIADVTAEGVALWGMQKAANWTSSKGITNFKDILSKTDSIKAIDPTVRGAILSAAEEISAENMQKTFDSIQDMSAVSNGKISVNKVEGFSRLMEQQEHLKDSASMSRAVQEGLKEIGLSSLNEYAEKNGINYQSIPSKLNRSIGELSDTIKDSYENSIGKAFGKNPDGSEKTVRLSEIISKDTIMNLYLPKNGTARDALVNGVFKLGEKGFIDSVYADRLARLIQNGKNQKAVDLINSIGEVNPVAAHWLKSELGKGWIEGRNNDGVGELKRRMKGVLENNMTQDQMIDYDLTQSEYSTYKMVLNLFRNHLDERSGNQDSVTLSNKFPEVTDVLGSLQARLIGQNKSSKVIGELSKLRDDLGLNLFYESIARKGKYTRETISTIRSKIEPSIGNEGHRRAINTAADLMQNSATRGTHSVGKTSTGTYKTSEWVSDIISAWVLGLGKAGKNVIGNIYKRLPGSETGIAKEAALKMAELTDVFINNPDIMELVRETLEDPILKKSRVSTNRLIFGLSNQSSSEEE